MKITRQEIDAQNGVLKVEIAAADYQNKVKAALDKYRKTAKIPGFRPGHVPAGLIQKQYGKSRCFRSRTTKTSGKERTKN